jgi:hypothetical protein
MVAAAEGFWFGFWLDLDAAAVVVTASVEGFWFGFWLCLGLCV